MFVIEIQFNGQWALYQRCVTPRATHAEFMSLEESQQILERLQSRLTWTLRLSAI